MSEAKLSVIVQRDGYDKLFESEQAAEHPDVKLAKLETRIAELDAKNGEQNSLRYRAEDRAKRAEKLLQELAEKLAPTNAKAPEAQAR